MPHNQAQLAVPSLDWKILKLEVVHEKLKTFSKILKDFQRFERFERKKIRKEFKEFCKEFR